MSDPVTQVHDTVQSDPTLVLLDLLHDDAGTTRYLYGLLPAPATSPLPATPSLEQAREEALRSLDQMLEAHLQDITADLSPAQLPFWFSRESAARAYLGGSPSTLEQQLIEAEAAGSSLTASALAQELADRGAVYRGAIAAAENIRRRGREALLAAGDLAAVTLALDQAETEIAAA
ncbi:hypothetical protein [Pseudooceanicola marinus]|uniref:hypothetical protein n=1 Tax=Pseudooceanicola marinus TaxID=396013 RepID=UPI001CD555BD|nr:hypothetical protein [Pseudooceanicola marinus]MCA1338191.1 hypothetical protein [Pseudooceanicola marinus]